MEQKIITPKKLQGFVELDPMKQLQFNEFQDKIKSVFERHCFVPLDTPILEYSEILLAKSGGDIDKEIYRFKKGDTDICMRYDLTVPLARFVAMNFNALNFPFKRYQIGKVFRGERPQKGRFREFYQCDADIIGLDDLPVLADAECVTLYKECFEALNIPVVVNISNRNLINGLLEDLKIENNMDQILTIIDKLDKIGKDGITKEFFELGLTQKAIDKILQFSENKGSLDVVLKKIENLCDNEKYQKGIADLKELDTYLKAYGLTAKDYSYDCSIIRGHNYYTGTVFECFVVGHKEFGAVGAGGRYDNLATYYTDKKLPGVGMSIGLTRLFDVLTTNGLLEEPKKALTQVLIIPMGETIKQCVEISKRFIDSGIKTDIAGEAKSFKSKMKDANRREVPFVLIIGEDEVKTQKYALKNMQTGEQKNLNEKELIEELKK